MQHGLPGLSAPSRAVSDADLPVSGIGIVEPGTPGPHADNLRRVKHPAHFHRQTALCHLLIDSRIVLKHRERKERRPGALDVTWHLRVGERVGAGKRCAEVRTSSYWAVFLNGFIGGQEHGKGRAVKKRGKITVLLDEREFRRFEMFCTEKGHKKSTLIARLIRDHLDGQGFSAGEGLSLSSETREAVGVR